MIWCWWDQQERGNVTASGFIRAPIKTVAPFYFAVSMCHRSRFANIGYPLHLLPRRARPPLRRPIDSLFIFHFTKEKPLHNGAAFQRLPPMPRVNTRMGSLVTGSAPVYTRACVAKTTRDYRTIQTARGPRLPYKPPHPRVSSSSSLAYLEFPSRTGEYREWD